MTDSLTTHPRYEPFARSHFSPTFPSLVSQDRPRCDMSKHTRHEQDLGSGPGDAVSVSPIDYPQHPATSLFPFIVVYSTESPGQWNRRAQ